MLKTKNIYLMITDAGGGHRSSANALQKVIEQRQLLWRVHIVNFYKDVVGAKWDEAIYNNLILKRSWMRIYWPLVVPLFKLKIYLLRATWLAHLEKYWHHQKPDLVVSLMPFLNRELCESLQKALPGIPFLTLMTDLIDPAPHYWIEKQEQFLICPTKQAAEQAISLGHQKDHIFCTSGLVINPQFYQPILCNRKVERQRLNLDADLPTVLVMFGGNGSKKMIEIANYLENSSLNLQLIFICGRNGKLATTLRKTQSRLPKFVSTFTNQIPYYMYLSDFFIGKPGPGAISEAIAMNLPVITEINGSTMKQEKYCGQWIEDNQVGIVVSHFRNIDWAVAELIELKNLVRYKKNAAAINNQGVFEVADILEKILAITS